MGDVLIIVGVGAGAFIGTNLDNLLLLVAMYARYPQQSGTVVAGYVFGMVLICLIALLLGETGDYVPLDWLGLLGLVPMTMGILALWKLFRKSAAETTDSFAECDSRRTIFSLLASTQLSNGADTIITFTILFAESGDPADYLLVPTFLAMIGVFSGLAYYSVKQAKLGRVLRRYGQYVTPFILILVGFYILSNTASDLVPG